MIQKIQIIEGPDSIGTKEFLEEKGLNTENIGFENADFRLGTIITQNPNPEELQELIYQVRKQSGVLIDDTRLDYGEHRIGFPMPSKDEMKYGSNFKIIHTDLPEYYIQEIRKEIQGLMKKHPGFHINYNLFCHNTNIINKIIYDLIMLNLGEKRHEIFSQNASSLLKGNSANGTQKVSGKNIDLFQQPVNSIEPTNLCTLDYKTMQLKKS